MHPPIVNFELDFDREKLLAEATDPAGYETFVDPKTKLAIKGWCIKKVNAGYALEISDFFKEYFQLKDCRPRFYIQEPGIDIKFHIDRATLCSFNFVLSDNPDPITFRFGKVFYTSALLNTTVEHAVLSTRTKRILFKISVFDKTFEEIKDVLPHKLQLR